MVQFAILEDISYEAANRITNHSTFEGATGRVNKFTYVEVLRKFIEREPIITICKQTYLYNTVESQNNLFDRMFQKLKIQRSREMKYPPELVSTMELLPTMHDVAGELMSCSDAISRRFQLKDGTTTASEKLALSIKILTPKVAEHEEYANFLKAQSEMYNTIGNMQRTMYTEIQDRVTNQLKTWIISDYERIINSIASLKEKQWQLDMATAEAEKGGPKDEKAETAKSFKLEQSRKDYEMQLALVKADLSKIPTILIEQAICLKRFNKLMFDYHKQMEEVLKKFGAGKV